MKKMLVAVFVVAMAPLAYAQYTAPATPDASKNPPAAPADAASNPNALTAQTHAEQAKRVLGDRNCVRDTGTIIQRKDKDTCVNTTGQSYGETPIGYTGTYNTGEALERLTPSIQVRPGR